MDAKNVRMKVELKAAGREGQFTATFATLNVIDKDGDVTIAGAFVDGAPVRISAWGHNWGALPVGKGTIHADDERAWVDGEFFLDTTHGKDTYLTVKNLGELQEWSYGFDIDKQAFGKFEERDVRFLEGLTVHEVSPVLIGAGVDTRTDAIKGAKVGQRNSAADQKRVQTIHDTLVELGAKCAVDDAPKGNEPEPDAKAEEPEGAKAEEQTVEGSFFAQKVALQLLELGVT